MLGGNKSKISFVWTHTTLELQASKIWQDKILKFSMFEKS